MSDKDIISEAIDARKAKRIKRQTVIDGLRDWFVTIFGLLAIIVGAFELILPELLPITLGSSLKPDLVLVIGAGLFMGPKIYRDLIDFAKQID